MRILNNILFFAILSFGFLGCCEEEEAFPYPELLDEWTLQWYEDANGNKLYERPDSIPRDIILVLRNDFSIGGQLVTTTDVSGHFTVEEGQRLFLDVRYPELLLQYEWDTFFEEVFPQVYRFDLDSRFLRLEYAQDGKRMVFSK